MATVEVNRDTPVPPPVTGYTVHLTENEMWSILTALYTVQGTQAMQDKVAAMSDKSYSTLKPPRHVAVSGLDSTGTQTLYQALRDNI